MKAIICPAYGGPEVLQVQTVEKPVPQENQVLIQIHASSVTRADSMMRTGTPYIGRLYIGLQKPKNPILGTGFAGVIEAVGSAVTNFQIGDAVFGESVEHFGANAEYLCVDADGILSIKPESMSFEEASVVCDGALTSINFLKEVAKIQPGQRVLINGASGSLGTAAVQLAKYYGAEVTGMCSSKNVDLVKSLGADVVIDYTKEDFTQNSTKFDIIYDTVGKLDFSKSRNALKPTGVFVSPVLDFSLLWDVLKTSFSKTQKALFAATGMKNKTELKVLLNELTGIIKAGRLQSVIDRCYDMEEIVEAHEYVASGRKRGNVVLNPAQAN
ncbi:MAG: NAD(P)-dependent alcohol dehydrogenase [Saprospiraceae bacterium]